MNSEKTNRLLPDKLVIVNAIFVVSLVISNVVSAKILQLGPLQVPGAALCYCITFLCTDIIGELFGKEQANKTVMLGFVCQCLASALILFTQFLPCADYAVETSQAYNTLLGTNWKFFLASMTAYFISQKLDVYIFHGIRDKYIAKHGSTKGGRWIWNNVGTMTSQLVDTIIFITIAFAGTVPDLKVMIISQYVFKVGLALLDTPFFYLFTSRREAR